MTIIHHPSAATLMSFSAGTLGEALSAVVAAHADLCPQCTLELRRMNDVGAALFEAMKPVVLTRPEPVPRSERGDRRPAATAGAVARTDVPRPIRHLAGDQLSRVPWKRLGYGLWHFRLPLSPGVKGDLRLLKVAPGMVMPEHGHGGAELTLLLGGSYRDEVGSFRRGDVADLDQDVEHQPVASPEDGCICLIASEEKARFRSLLARLVQPLTGF